jgi:glucosamine--fructose-6-phosphate aminotransferase (isomerizing)
MAYLRKTIDVDKYIYLVRELKKLPEKIEETLQACRDKAKAVAEELHNKNDIFYIGRQKDYATASEGSLKMKEISYLNSQAYAAGELKHGTISLVEKGTPVVAVAGEKSVFYKTLTTISEVVARGAEVTAITDVSKAKHIKNSKEIFSVSSTADELLPSLLVLPLQLIAYYTALERGCDIDKPKNLAKSVTVE